MIIDIEKILELLVNARSVSPEDGGLTDKIKEILIENGFKVYTKKFGAGLEETTNLYAEFGTKGKNLCFAGHIDVVPPGDETLWKYNPFLLTREGDIYFGRGVVDMKGAVAAMILALMKWSKGNNEGKVSLLLTSDEEGKAEYGTKEMLKWMDESNIKIDYCIVGEPTSDKQFGDTIKIGRRGSVCYEIVVNGAQGHVAYPENAKNPHIILVSILKKLCDIKLDNGSDYFPKSNLEIVSIDTKNDTWNLIPSKTTAKINIRFSNQHNEKSLRDLIENVIKEFTSDYIINLVNLSTPYLSEKSEFTKTFSSLVEKHTGHKPVFSTSGGTSDARFISNYCHCCEFGLLNKTAHQIDEHTEIIHLQKLASVYYGAVEAFHGLL